MVNLTNKKPTPSVILNKIENNRLSVNLFDINKLICSESSNPISAKNIIKIIKRNTFDKREAKLDSFLSNKVLEKPSKFNSLLYLDGMMNFQPNILFYDRQNDDQEQNDIKFSDFL